MHFPGRPNQPSGLVLNGRTSSSIAVRWSAGYDGGENQWFHVSHKKTADSSETFSDRIDGGVTTYNVDGLESYTEYEIKVYAENDVGKNPSPASVVEYTLRKFVCFNFKYFAPFIDTNLQHLNFLSLFMDKE